MDEGVVEQNCYQPTVHFVSKSKKIKRSKAINRRYYAVNRR